MKRILYFDALTIFACFAVVCLHCNQLAHHFSPTDAWSQALVVEVIMFWAVPIFFMLTGANNMRYREKYDTATFLKRRMKKLVIPLVFWTAFLYVLDHVILHNAMDASILGYLADFMDCRIEPIYWFFFAIISLTLAMPILSLLVEHRKAMWYLVGVSFLLTFFIPFLGKAFDFPWTGAFNLPVAGGFVTYAVLGYLLATQEVAKKQRVAIYVIAVLCLVLRYWYTYTASYAEGVLVRALFDYNAFFAFFPAIAVFLLFKHARLNAPPARVQHLVTTISGCSFGVYLIHNIILKHIVLGYFGLPLESAFVRIVCPFLLFILSIALVFIMKKIPVVRQLVP